MAAALVLAGLLHAASGQEQPRVVAEFEQGEGVSVTVYNQDFVVVRERRWMDLPAGRSTVRFPDVAATIVPETVQFTVLGKPDAARVLEQSYEFDLVNADKLLDRYVDRDITLVTRDGGTLKGKLLSFDSSQMVLQTADGIDLVPRTGNVKDVQFSALPERLLTRPTLVWEVDARAAGKQLVKVAYAAGKMKWRADYRAIVHAAGGKLDLAGWVTVKNLTGTTFKDAQVKLLAGDVHLTSDSKFKGVVDTDGTLEIALGGWVPLQSKAFGDYHLYQLNRPATLADRATKQVELLEVPNIPVVKRYVLPTSVERVAVYLEFKNSAESAKGLGIPLPLGQVRVFQRDADGTPEFIAQTAIGHTPKDEVVRLPVGSAFDLKAARKVLAERAAEGKRELDVEVRLRNHTKEAVSIEVFESVPRADQWNWKILKSSLPFERRDVGTVTFAVPVPANGESVLTYTVRTTKDRDPGELK
jgi:hypothetical protein